ncbi:MAG TPA: hypothetical protein VFF46_05430, partial [Kribbella sp.]|nr:hypothetical protein [Kribbella sp.]
LAGPGARRITDGVAATDVRPLRPLHILSADDGYLFLRHGRDLRPAPAGEAGGDVPPASAEGVG